MSILSFMGEQPVLTFLAAWVVVHGVAQMYSRTMRMLMVRKHGWPPEHLDADGDFKAGEDVE